MRAISQEVDGSSHLSEVDVYGLDTLTWRSAGGRPLHAARLLSALYDGSSASSSYREAVDVLRHGLPLKLQHRQGSGWHQQQQQQEQADGRQADGRQAGGRQAESGQRQQQHISKQQKHKEELQLNQRKPQQQQQRQQQPQQQQPQQTNDSGDATEPEVSKVSEAAAQYKGDIVEPHEHNSLPVCSLPPFQRAKGFVRLAGCGSQLWTWSTAGTTFAPSNLYGLF